MKRPLAVFLCLLLLFTTGACRKEPDKSQTQPTSQTSQIPQTPQAPQAPKTPQELYADIISDYTSLLTDKCNGKELSAPSTDGMTDREIDIAEALFNIANSGSSAESAKTLGYGFKDMDGNGIPELLLMTQYNSILAIFTVSDNKPILLEASYGKGNSLVFATRNRFFMTRRNTSDNVEEVIFYICRVDGDKMAYDSIYGQVSEQQKIEMFQIIGENRTVIDKDTYDKLDGEFQKSRTPNYYHIPKLAAPRIHFPLKSSDTSNKLPLADFSDYAAIRETYKAISACIDKFDSFSWSRGAYDDLFAFSDDTCFDYYNRLLYTIYRGGHYAPGYDEIDLNGDGQDELVILSSSYNIKAIFTQKDGKPVLVDTFGISTCWLDDQGFIHVDRVDYDELEYSLYEFTKSGEYNFIYSILITNKGNRYLTKNGKTEIISFEKSLELYYDDYCRYSEPFDPNEQTRNVSRLSYTPITEVTENPITSAVDKSWHKYAKLEKTSGKELARSNTYVSFKRLNDTEIKINIKYVFTFSYPDPNQSNIYLNDSTESYFTFTARVENGTLVFSEDGIKGKIEFGTEHLWLIIEESTNQCFTAGYHIYEEYVPNEV